MKRLAIIPARSGSKGLKDKNILLVNGKPLIAYTIEAAKNSNSFTKIIVSSDSDYYGDIAKEYNVTFDKRKKHLASDTATSFDVIKDILERETNSYDYFILLQPTSPLRDYNDIKNAIKQFDNNIEKYSSLVSLTKAHKPSCLIREVDDDLSLKNYIFEAKNFRRQQYQEYETNGAIFISTIDKYLQTGSFFGKESMAFIMDSTHSLEIDSKYDFEMLLTLINNQNKYENTVNNVLKRIKEKNFKTTGEITLIGNSIFDKWNIKKIANKTINNWGVNASTAKMIKDYVFNKKYTTIGDIVIINFGTNEMIFSDNINDIVTEINDLIIEIKKYKPQKIYFLGIISVNGRIDRDNEIIKKYNKIFRKKIICDKYISPQELNNKYGMLDLSYTIDGLHLNNSGYKKLLTIIEREIEE